MKKQFKILLAIVLIPVALFVIPPLLYASYILALYTFDRPELDRQLAEMHKQNEIERTSVWHSHKRYPTNQ